MKPKKNPNKNLNSQKTLYFQIGLVASLILILFLVEWKTDQHYIPNQDQLSYEFLEPDEVLMLDIPQKELESLKKINKISDEPFIEKQPIEEPIENQLLEEKPKLTESTSEKKVVDFSELEPVEKDPIKEILFEIIEDVPIFTGCEQYSSNTDRKSCMSDRVQKFIQKEFNTDLASDLRLSGINRIYTSFKIKTTGEVEFIQARAPHPKLQAEAQRVIEKLPQIQPGKQRGTPVNVIFALPITFKVAQ